MDYLNVLLTSLSACLILATASASYGFLTRERRHAFEADRELRREEQLRMREYQREEYARNREANSIEQLTAFLPRMMEELPQETAAAVVTQLQRPTQGVDTASAVLSEGAVNSAQVVREIAHSLNTPLAQIETAVMLAIAKGNSDVSEHLRHIGQSMQLCKAFISAFKEITSLAVSATGWQPASLNEAVNSGASVYIERLHTDVKVSADLPGNITGYSNNYILAMLLPLLENALEASRADSEVSVRYSEEAEYSELRVTNVAEQLPGDINIYASGYTSKQNHEGLGLAMVRRLAEAQRGATLTHDVSGETVTFTLSFPRRIVR